MRRVAALLLLVLAWPAGASPDPTPQSPDPPPPAAAKKPVATPVPRPRYPTVDEALALAPPPSTAQSRTPPPLRSRVPIPSLTVDDTCRSACAQSYYFCAAGEPGDCGGSFSQCSAACDAPNLAAGVPDLAP